MLSPAELLEKYDVPVARYTSYPAVPFWRELKSDSKWKDDFRRNFLQHNAREGISLYLHLPFCESLCTYCGCNKKITANHRVEAVYIEALLKEWEIYCGLAEEPPLIRELHLGGGTPTFFSPRNLRRLLEGIFRTALIHPLHEFSVEGHPNNTTCAHLEMFYGQGFRRVSFGVQDNDPVVQRAINRIQPLENVKRVTEAARATGFRSVNFDLIYGLPFQTTEGITRTIDEVTGLRPDRIAFYSYAHVPWKQKAQRLFDENDLPAPALKMQLYRLAKEKFHAAGYVDIGMDHFALRGDDLYKAWMDGSLHRNFMGYTPVRTSFLLALGVSAISDTGTAYAQNHKDLNTYYRTVNSGRIPVYKGYFLDETDQAFKSYILQASCRGAVAFKPEHRDLLQQYTLPRLQDMAEDGLLLLDTKGFQVTSAGRQFIRNICQAFDLKWLSTGGKSTEKVFSRSV